MTSILPPTGDDLVQLIYKHFPDDPIIDFIEPPDPSANDLPKIAGYHQVWSRLQGKRWVEMCDPESNLNRLGQYRAELFFMPQDVAKYYLPAYMVANLKGYDLLAAENDAAATVDFVSDNWEKMLDFDQPMKNCIFYFVQIHRLKTAATDHDHSIYEENEFKNFSQAFAKN